MSTLHQPDSRRPGSGLRLGTGLPTGNREHNDVTWADDASRLDAIAKVTGRAKYGMDQVGGDTVVAAFVRCPWGRAELVSCDEDAARAVPGVLEVDAADNVGGTFTYHGHNAGHVVAETPTALRRGLAALACEWRRLSAVVDIDQAQPPMPEIDAEEQARLDEVLARADHVVDTVYETQVQTHSSLETHGGRVDATSDPVMVHGSTQSNFGFRDEIARTLDRPNNAVEMHCEYVGGGFGSKFGAGKEGRLAAQVSARLGRPCRVFCDRAEEHLDTGNRPSSRQHFRIGATADGRITGGAHITFGGVGVGGRGGGVSEPRYDLGDLVVREHRNVSFNAGAPRAFRAPGHPQAMFAVELLMDELASGIGMDPLEFRRRNETSETRKRMYEAGSRLIGWSDRVANGSRTGSLKRGYGMGSTDWKDIRTSAEAEVVIHPDGSVEARSGTQDIGTGQRTVMAIVAAEHLGVPLAVVGSRVGNTTLPVGPASGGSVTAPNSAAAMIAAALDVRGKFLDRVADRTGMNGGDLDLVDGSVIDRRNHEPVVAWSEACSLLTGPVTGRGATSRGDARHRGDGRTDGVQFAEVVVDTETGVIKVERIVALQACGKIVCRKTAESQVIGGVIQGVSYALFENRILDRVTGAMVNPNLESYKIAGAIDMPEIHPILWDDGATGVRSLGEPPTIPTAGAIACAVYNAIGTPVRSLPLTPDRVLAALDEGRGGGRRR